MMKRTILLFVCSLFIWRLGAQVSAVTDSAAAQLGRALESDDDAQRGSLLGQLLDPASFISRMTEACPPLKDPAYRRGFTETFVPSLPRIGAAIGTVGTSGSYRLLREYDSNGVKHLLFRTISDNGLNYHDYVLTRVRDSIKFADFYLYTTGEYYSQTMADIVTVMDASKNLEKETEEVKALKKMREFSKQHMYQEAKSIYDGMSPKLRDVKAIQVIYVAVAHHLNDSLYEAALDHFQTTFPNSPNSYLMMIDLCFLKKEYQKGIEVVDKLDGLVRDPILNLYRGNFVLVSSGKREDAVSYYEKAYQFDPGVKLNTRTLIMTYAVLGRMDDAKRVIAGFKLQRGFQPEDLSTIYTAYPSLKD